MWLRTNPHTRERNSPQYPPRDCGPLPLLVYHGIALQAHRGYLRSLALTALIWTLVSDLAYVPTLFVGALNDSTLIYREYLAGALRVVPKESRKSNQMVILLILLPFYLLYVSGMVGSSSPPSEVLHHGTIPLSSSFAYGILYYYWARLAHT